MAEIRQPERVRWTAWGPGLDKVSWARLFYDARGVAANVGHSIASEPVERRLRRRRTLRGPGRPARGAPVASGGPVLVLRRAAWGASAARANRFARPIPAGESDALFAHEKPRAWGSRRMPEVAAHTGGANRRNVALG